MQSLRGPSRHTATSGTAVDSLSLFAGPMRVVPPPPLSEFVVMDCRTVRSLLVPFTEGELAPAEMEWVGAHLSACRTCADAAARVRAHGDRLSAFAPPPMSGAFAADLFAKMDADLSHALDDLQSAGSPTPNAAPAVVAARTGELRLRPAGIVVYAAAILLLGLWGWSRHEAADRAEQRVQDLELALERAERLRANPSPQPMPGESWRAVAYTRERGHL